MFRPVINNLWTHQSRYHRKTFEARGGMSEGHSTPQVKERFFVLKRADLVDFGSVGGGFRRCRRVFLPLGFPDQHHHRVGDELLRELQSVDLPERMLQGFTDVSPELVWFPSGLTLERQLGDKPEEFSGECLRHEAFGIFQAFLESFLSLGGLGQLGLVAVFDLLDFIPAIHLGLGGLLSSGIPPNIDHKPGKGQDEKNTKDLPKATHDLVESFAPLGVGRDPEGWHTDQETYRHRWHGVVPCLRGEGNHPCPRNGKVVVTLFCPNSEENGHKDDRDAKCHGGHDTRQRREPRQKHSSRERECPQECQANPHSHKRIPPEKFFYLRVHANPPLVLISQEQEVRNKKLAVTTLKKV